MAICTIDGQQFSLGDCHSHWCFQSVSKAFNYAIVIVASEPGESLHSFVGHESSGRLFNEICLDANGKPHNPMINSGVNIVTLLMKRGMNMADRYDFNPVDEVAEIFTVEHRKCDPPIEYKNGQKVGEFRFGSTMVMVFEAPHNFEFCLMPGEVVKYGQQLMMNMGEE